MFEKMRQYKDAVKNPLSKIKASIKDISKQMIAKQQIQVIQIVPNKLYHISYPTLNNFQYWQEELKKANQFQIWNIGQYSYSQEILSKILGNGVRNSDGKQVVYNLTYQFFANIPFCQMIKAIENIESFLSIHKKNKVFVHCQQNKRRSAVFLSSYIYLAGIQTDIVQAILKINRLLNIQMEDKQISNQSINSIYKSQHLTLKNLMNYINNNAFINKNCWYLRKIMISNAPKIYEIVKIENEQPKQLNNQKEQNIKYKVLLQIRSAQGIIYRKVFSDQFIQGESLCLRIAFNELIQLKDDFLIIIKYVYDKKGYSVLRAQLNTNFIYDQYYRINSNDMDLSINNIHSKNTQIFMDLFMEKNELENSQLSNLNILKQNQSKNYLSNERGVKQMNLLDFQEYNDIKRQRSDTNKLKHKDQQEQENDFRILDEQQQAEHNQKIQRQIEEELQRELQKMKNKKSKSKEVKEEYKLNQQQVVKEKKLMKVQANLLDFNINNQNIKTTILANEQGIQNKIQQYPDFLQAKELNCIQRQIEENRETDGEQRGQRQLHLERKIQSKIEQEEKVVMIEEAGLIERTQEKNLVQGVQMNDNKEMEQEMKQLDGVKKQNKNKQELKEAVIQSIKSQGVNANNQNNQQKVQSFQLQPQFNVKSLQSQFNAKQLQSQFNAKSQSSKQLQQKNTKLQQSLTKQKQQSRKNQLQQLIQKQQQNKNKQVEPNEKQSQQSSSQQSSQEDEQEDEQEDQEQQDLDDYLEKLQQQAANT